MTAVDQADDIDHGTPRGARQHTRRRVLPVCGPCQEAIATERDADTWQANAGREAAFNRGPVSRKQKQKKRRESAGTVGARQVSPARELTPWERRRTVRLLASRAAGAADLRELLAAVDLSAADGKTAPITPVTPVTAMSSAQGGC